jgi:hypothetical protein
MARRHPRHLPRNSSRRLVARLRAAKFDERLTPLYCDSRADGGVVNANAVRVLKIK